MSLRRALPLAAAGLGGLALGAIGLTVAGCGTTLLNAFSSNAVYRAERDVRYRDGDRGTLDVYAPEGVQGPAPVLVFFYGGGWKDGSKSMYEFVASSFAREGYLVVIPDYRLWPEVTFPAFAEDAAASVAWVQANAARFGGDPGRIVLAGHSAGAHLAALVALDDELLRAAGGNAGSIAALVGLSGPYDFLPLDEGSDLERIFPEETREASQPVNHVANASHVPPTLLVHGTGDDRVLPRNTRRFAAALEENGTPAAVRWYDGVGHARVAAALAPPIRFVADTREDVLAWLAETLPAATATE